jgi:prefoldin subunit 5
MEHHLTERELIEYQFKLASDMQTKEAAEHLQGCGQCREHLEKLQQKFAALDLLRGEAKISEDLISRVVEQAGQPVRTRIVWFKKYAWLSSAAAVLLIGVLLVATQLSKDGTKKREVAKGPTPVAEEMELASKPEITPVERLDKDAVRKRTFAMAPKEKEAGRYAAFGETAEAAIPEQPPFAPASAIELVTLPRRDKVQLTIYNSTFQTSIVDKGGYGGFGGPLGPRHGRGYREYGQPYGQPSDLIMLIQETIEPDSWFDMSDTGEGTIQVYDKKLVVRQTPQIHQKIKKLLQAIKALPDEQAKSESSTTIDQIRTDSFVYKQIDRIVDLSDLKPEMSFGEVIERLENSVQPPIQIQPNWKDLLENAEVERSTPVGMDPLTGVTLRKALEILLAGISSVDFAELNYVVDEGVILIGTMDMLRPKMETRVYNISDSGGGGGITSDSVKLKVEESKAQSLKRNVVSRRPVDILPDSLTLVRERRNLTLKKGWNWLQFGAAGPGRQN